MSDAEREAARRSDGKFGSYGRTGAEVALDDAFTEDDRVYATFVRQVWANDYAREVGEETVDVRAIADSLPLAALPRDWGSESDKVEALTERLLDYGSISHDGPSYLLEPDNWADYITYREALGLAEAEPLRPTARDLDAINEAWHNAQRELWVRQRNALVATTVHIARGFDWRGDVSFLVDDETRTVLAIARDCPPELREQLDNRISYELVYGLDNLTVTV